MSKLYKKYILLKVNNSHKLYLFECGIFYIFIHEDAILMSKLLNLKLSPLNSTVMKCGFPVKSAEKYLNFLKNSEYDVEIVPSDHDFTLANLNDYSVSQSLDNIICDFLKVNIDEVSVSQAFELLTDLQNKFKKIELERKNYGKKY